MHKLYFRIPTSCSYGYSDIAFSPNYSVVSAESAETDIHRHWQWIVIPCLSDKCKGEQQ